MADAAGPPQGVKAPSGGSSRPFQVLVLNQIAKSGLDRLPAGAYVTASGSPGPFDKNTPCGFCASTSFAVVVEGTTVIRQPRSSNMRRMLRLMP